MKRYDLMQQINTRGTYMVTKFALPHLEKAANPHVLMLSPPLDMKEHWFAPHVAYSIAKYGMSLCVLGFAGEFRPRGIAVNALWPRTTIATAAIKNLLGGDAIMRASRTPEILADAAYLIFQKPSREFHRQFPDRRHVSRLGRRHRPRPLPRRSERRAAAGFLRAGGFKAAGLARTGRALSLIERAAPRARPLRIPPALHQRPRARRRRPPAARCAA